MHLVEKQIPSEKELIQQIKEAERELLMLDKNDRVLAQLSLTIQLYYLNGGNDEGKQKALNIIDKFKNTYPLKSHFPFNASGFTEFTEKSYQSAFKNAKMPKCQNAKMPKCQNAKMPKCQNAKKPNVMEWYLCSAESNEFAAKYALGIFTARDNYGLSHLQLNFPISLVYEENGRKEFNAWIEELLTQFQVFHGYAGLSIQLPYDRHPYQFYEYGVTRQYWGITPDGASFLKRDWYEGIRSINWYTFIGKDLKDKFIHQPFYNVTLKNSDPRQNNGHIVPLKIT